MGDFLWNPEISNSVQTMIIPTVMIPLTAITVALSMLASFIAGLFGIQLKTEGPKRLLEVLLKPRVLLGALALNFAILGGVHGYTYVKNYPRFLWTIQRNQEKEAKESNRHYENHHAVVGEHILSGSSAKLRTVGAPVVLAQKVESTQFAQRNELNAVWTQTLPKGAFRAPLVSGGSLFVGSMDGFVYELDAPSGQLIRRFFVGTPVTPELTIDDGKMFVGEGVHETHSARIYAFDLKSGALAGTYQTKGHTEGQPVIAEHGGQKLLFAVSGSDGVHAIDPQTMTARWTANAGHIDSSVRVFNGRVFTGTGREKGDTEKNRAYAVAYEFSKGTELWKVELPASSWMSPVIWRDEVCFVFGEVYFESGLGGIQCFRQDSGRPTRSINLASPQTTLPLVIGDALITTDSKGTVCSLDLNSQQTQWCQKVAFKKGMNFASPVYSPERDALVYASMDDGLYVLDRASGRVLSRTVVKDLKAVYAPVEVSGLDIFVSDIKGRVLLMR